MAGNRGRGRHRPRTKAGQAVLLAFGTVLIGGISAALFWLLARTCAYLGVDAVLPVSAGIAAAIVVPWGYSRGTARDVTARWPTWLLVGYVLALVVGMRYYLAIRFRHAGPRPPGLPPLVFQVQVAGLAAEVLTLAVLTLIMIAVTILPLVPAGRLPRLQSLISARARHARTAARLRDNRLPVRLRLVRPDAQHGKWLRGAMRMAPGSLLWEPAKGVDAPTVELAHATVLPATAPAKTRRRSTQPSRLIALETPIGRADLEFPLELFPTVQKMAAAMAAAHPTDGT